MTNGEPMLLQYTVLQVDGLNQRLLSGDANILYEYILRQSFCRKHTKRDDVDLYPV